MNRCIKLINKYLLFRHSINVNFRETVLRYSVNGNRDLVTLSGTNNVEFAFIAVFLLK